jgi:hypothetical protein
MLNIEDFRKTYPEADDLSDAEVMSRVAKYTQLPLEQVAQDFGIAQPGKAPRGALGAMLPWVVLRQVLISLLPGQVYPKGYRVS